MRSTLFTIALIAITFLWAFTFKACTEKENTKRTTTDDPKRAETEPILKTEKDTFIFKSYENGEERYDTIIWK